MLPKVRAVGSSENPEGVPSMCTVCPPLTDLPKSGRGWGDFPLPPSPGSDGPESAVMISIDSNHLPIKY